MLFLILPPNFSRFVIWLDCMFLVTAESDTNVSITGPLNFQVWRRFSTRKALELAINEGSDLESDEDSADEINLFSGEEFIPANDHFGDDSDRDRISCEAESRQ